MGCAIVMVQLLLIERDTLHLDLISLLSAQESQMNNHVYKDLIE